MKNVLIFLLLIATANTLAQQNIKVSLQVANSFTGELVENGKCELLSPDSAFISDGKWQ